MTNERNADIARMRIHTRHTRVDARIRSVTFDLFLQNCDRKKTKSKGSVGAAYTMRLRLLTRSALKVAAGWHELIIPQSTMRPSIARISEQLDLQCSMQT